MFITICMLWFAMALDAPIWIFVLLGFSLMIQFISLAAKLLVKIIDDEKGE